MSSEVLVFDAHAVAMIAALRSLGRAGYKIHAVSHDSKALGFKSRFACEHAVHPEYHSPEFIEWLRFYLARFPVEGMICGEGVLHALRNDYKEFEHLIPDSVSDAVRRLCLSKALVWQHLASDPVTNKALPPSGILDCAATVDALVSSATDNAVFYLKPDREFARNSAKKPKVVRVNSRENLRNEAQAGLREYSSMLWQQHVPGMQVGVSLWIHGGEFVVENMVLGLHMYPYRAGSMSLRISWWHERIMEDAKLKTLALNWSGVAMLEYKWDPDTDKFWFIEINPRFWTYLHLDLLCGKDFPRWQMDSHFGNQAVVSKGRAESTRTLRYAPGEIIHLASCILTSEYSIAKKMKTIVEYATLSVSPKVDADLWFAGDRALYFRDWVRFISEVPSKVRRNLRNSSYVGSAP